MDFIYLTLEQKLEEIRECNKRGSFFESITKNHVKFKLILWGQRSKIHVYWALGLWELKSISIEL